MVPEILVDEKACWNPELKRTESLRFLEHEGKRAL